MPYISIWLSDKEHAALDKLRCSTGISTFAHQIVTNALSNEALPEHEQATNTTNYIAKKAYITFKERNTRSPTSSELVQMCTGLSYQQVWKAATAQGLVTLSKRQARDLKPLTDFLQNPNFCSCNFENHMIDSKVKIAGFTFSLQQSYNPVESALPEIIAVVKQFVANYGST